MKWYDYSPMALPFVARKRNIPGNISKFPGISPTQLSQVMKMRCEEGLKKYGVIISGGSCARLLPRGRCQVVETGYIPSQCAPPHLAWHSAGETGCIPSLQ